MKSMTKVFMVLALVAVIFLPVAASAALVTFDTLPTNQTFSVNGYTLNWDTIPSNYMGWTWSSSASPENWEVIKSTNLNAAYNNSITFPSSPNAAYNGDSGAATVTISFGSLYNVADAYFSTWTNANAAASSVTLKGYSGGTSGTLVGTVNVSLTNAMALTNIALNGIDTLTFSTNSGAYWLMDNMNASPVPIPPSALLLGTGMLGLVGLGWRRKGKVTA
jgi:hypothetical protein